VNPRVILTHLIARLELPGVTAVEETDAEERAAAGALHLFDALREAREALASGDGHRIAVAALVCPTLVRTGETMGARNARTAGGLTTGGKQTKDAEARWQPYVDAYRRLLDAGTSRTKARAITKRHMTRDDFTTARGSFPSDQAIGKHLK